MFTARVKRGLVLLCDGTPASNRGQRQDLEAARTWIRYGVERGGWLVKRARRPSWRESVASAELAERKGYS